MRNRVINLLGPLSSIISTNVLIKLTQQRLILPAYHLVSDEEVIHVKHLHNTVGVDEFKRDLDFLLKHYRPVDLKDLINSIENQSGFKNNSFFLSFDDGLSETFNVIAPILIEKGIPATFFINSKFIDNKDLSYRYKASLLIENIIINDELLRQINSILHKQLLNESEIKKAILEISYNDQGILDQIAAILEIDFNDYLRSRQPYLNSQQIKDLIKDGFTIGSHSIDHPDYRYLPLESQLIQTKVSTNAISNNFSLSYRCFAFPFTDYGVSADFFSEIYNKNDPVIDISFGGAGLKKDSYPAHFQRIPMDEKNFPAKTIINSEYLYYLLKAPFFRNKIRRK